jgi:hypothetical protein
MIYFAYEENSQHSRRRSTNKDLNGFSSSGAYSWFVAHLSHDGDHACPVPYEKNHLP